MGSFPEREHIIKAVLEGISKAQKDFFKWTNEQAWVSLAPEYMLNIYIGQALSQLKPMPQIWFEVGIEDVAMSSQLAAEHKDIFCKSVKRNNYESEKIDIVLDELNTSIPQVIIEVKSGISKQSKNIDEDIIRICQCLKHASNLQYGLFVAFANIAKNILLSKQLGEILQHMQSIKNTEKKIDIEMDFIISLEIRDIVTQDTDGWSCAAVCFIIERKGN